MVQHLEFLKEFKTKKVIMKKIYKYSFLLLLTLIVSCSNEEGYADLELDKSPVTSMSGDWYVQVFVDGALQKDYVLITTSNSNDNNGATLQISDKKHIYWFNAAVPANVSALTFAGTNIPSSVVDDNAATPNVVETYDITITVTNGVITKNGTTSTSGRTTDKISFDIKYSDDSSGTVYRVEGYKSTGFLEDEH